MSSGYLSEKDKSKKEMQFIKKPNCSAQLGFLVCRVVYLLNSILNEIKIFSVSPAASVLSFSGS
jgi:surface polysaccharide O-acyltransferase-like enzyme